MKRNCKLLHISEGCIIASIRSKSKQEWEEWFDNGGVVLHNPDDGLYWYFHSTDAINISSVQLEKLLLSRAELEIIEIQEKYNDYKI